jgi:hypothetical protein
MKQQAHVKVLELELNRKHFTRHGLHLNFEGKRIVSQKLALLIQNFHTKTNLETIIAPWKDPASSSTNSLTQDVNTSEGKNLPNKSAHQCRVCPAHRNPDFFMDMKHRNSQNKHQTKVNCDFINIYHQNIRNLRNKTQELLAHLHPNLPHVICLTEHHLHTQEVGCVNMENYTIGAQFCRSEYQSGGVIIYVHSCLNFTNIDLSAYCKEKIIEVCAVKVKANSQNMCIITIYRPPTGDCNYFLHQLDNVLKILYSPTTSLIIFGDLNINYLVENEQKIQLDNLLLIYNLMGIVNFQQELIKQLQLP